MQLCRFINFDLDAHIFSLAFNKRTKVKREKHAIFFITLYIRISNIKSTCNQAKVKCKGGKFLKKLQCCVGGKVYPCHHFVASHPWSLSHFLQHEAAKRIATLPGCDTGPLHVPSWIQTSFQDRLPILIHSPGQRKAL